MSVEIRRAEGDEIDAARDLTNRSWLSTYPPLIGDAQTRAIVEERHSRAVFLQQAARLQDRFLVALDQGAVVGHLYAFHKDGMYVDRLHVDPDCKGMGIGSLLLQHLERQLFSESRLWLDVLKGNDAALGFYQHVGYRVTGETDACGGLAGIPAIILEKQIR